MLRVLVVDDRPDTADSLSVLVGLWGHEPRVAFDGEQALREAASYRPHVVLLDVAMPGLNGFEVAGRLRELPGLQAVLLIAITGYDGRHERERAAAAGFEHYLVKPCNLTVLQDVLASRAAAHEAAPAAVPCAAS